MKYRFTLPHDILECLLRCNLHWEPSKVFSHHNSVQSGTVEPAVRRSKSASLTSNQSADLVSFLNSHVRRSIENDIARPLGNLTPVQMLAYSTDEFFSPHRDRGGPNRRALLTVIGAVKSPAAGGELRIMEPRDDIIGLVPGDIVVFPADILHEGCRVLAGDKLIFVCWFNEFQSN